MRFADASRPVMDSQRVAILAVRMPSPQPRSRILSEDWGSSHDIMVVVNSGTNDADAE